MAPLLLSIQDGTHMATLSCCGGLTGCGNSRSVHLTGVQVKKLKDRGALDEFRMTNSLPEH